MQRQLEIEFRNMQRSWPVEARVREGAERLERRIGRLVAFRAVVEHRRSPKGKSYRVRLEAHLPKAVLTIHRESGSGEQPADVGRAVHEALKAMDRRAEAALHDDRARPDAQVERLLDWIAALDPERERGEIAQENEWPARRARCGSSGEGNGTGPGDLAEGWQAERPPASTGRRRVAAPRIGSHCEPEEESPAKLALRSPDFASGEVIPVEHTCDGANRSPAFSWSGVPDGTASLLLVCVDLDAPFGPFHHWAAFDIPPHWNRLEAGFGRDYAGLGIRQAVNDFLLPGYCGPCPPQGGRQHAYLFRLSALDGRMEAGPCATCSEIVRLARAMTIASAELVGYYGR